MRSPTAASVATRPRVAPGARVHQHTTASGTSTRPCSLKPIAINVSATMMGACQDRGSLFISIHAINASGIPTIV